MLSDGRIKIFRVDISRVEVSYLIFVDAALLFILGSPELDERFLQWIELGIGLTLIAAFYLGGVTNPPLFFAKTLALLLVIVGLQSLLTRLRIDQTVGLWWRYGVLAVLVQWLAVILWPGGLV